LRGGLNTYRYVRNNPLRWKDPQGLSDGTFDPITGVVSVIGKDGAIGIYPAGNCTTNPSGDPYVVDSNGPAPSGTYPVQSPIDTSGQVEFGPTFWPIGAEGSNRERLDIPRKRGIGLHCGRRGPSSCTQGCIRMADEDCVRLGVDTSTDPLSQITIINRR
jgi:uncharacterized protein RhaS with RHS repeats